MHSRVKKAAAGAAIVVAAVLVGAAAQAIVGQNVRDGAPAPQGQRALGNGVSQNTFVPKIPCRILDTRKATAGALQVGSARAIDVRGNETTFTSQGGNPGGCTIPSGATAIEATITAIDSGSGFLRAWPANLTQPNATFLNYSPDLNVSNTGTVSLCISGCAANKDLNLQAYGSTTHLVIDVQGYYTPPMAAGVNDDGTLARSSRAVSSSRSTAGIYLVTFDRSITSCTYAGVIGGIDAGSPKGSISITPSVGNSAALYIETSNTAGTTTDQSFYVEVTC